MKVRAFCTRAIAMCTVAMMSLGLCAKTTTWTGPGSGKFSSSSNWNSGAPEPGDTVIVRRSGAYAHIEEHGYKQREVRGCEGGAGGLDFQS